MEATRTYIDPEQMADIYRKRMGTNASIGAVGTKLKLSPVFSKTYDYWRLVHDVLVARSQKGDRT